MKEFIRDLLTELTVEEKASLCSGLDFWNTKQVKRLDIPSVLMTDGPHGLRKENDEDDNVAMKQSFPATSFPPAVNLASTWNTALAREMGEALGEQCLDQNVSTILGPGTNIKRNPLCSRNFEYFSEDPYLSGKMCVNYIKGVQSKGVGTSLKHFAANNQEYLRYTINAVIDERTLREIYLAPFEMAVKEAQPWTVMCSYNKINGVQSSDNKRLLTDILRSEWRFKGIVMTDWNAMNDRVEAVNAGLELEMPASGGRTDKEIVKAVQNGKISIDQLDLIVGRLLEYIFKCHENLQPEYKADYEKHHAVAKKVADESIVLLKNDKKILPLKDRTDLAVIGALAKQCRYQGSGSSRINPYHLVNFTDKLDAENIDYQYAEGYNLTKDTINEQMIEEAVFLAKTYKNVLVFVGLTEADENEGADRRHMNLPRAHDRLVEAVMEVNPQAVVVLMGGAPVEMPWENQTPTLLNAYLAGEAVGESIYDILFGRVCPSGKLAETYPILLNDCMTTQYFGMGPKNVEHRESIFVGYRYFDAAEKAVRFPFGHGLSYTSFEYSDLDVSAKQIMEHETLSVRVKVTNTGPVDGAEVVQLYVKDIESTLFRPEKELKDFAKVFLKKGESKVVEFTLNKRSFAFYNVNINDWYIESGSFEILIGGSSRDIRLSETVHVESVIKDAPMRANLRELCPVYYNLKGAEEIPFDQFSYLYRNLIPSNAPTKRGDFTRASTVGELRCCVAGKALYAVAPKFFLDQMPNADFNVVMIMKKVFAEMPMRALNGVTTGLLDIDVVDGIILWANKHRLKGFFKIVNGMIKSLGNVQRQNKMRELKREKKRIKEAQKVQLESLKQQIDSKIEDLKLAREELKLVLKDYPDQIEVERIEELKQAQEELKVARKELKTIQKDQKTEIISKNEKVLEELTDDIRGMKKKK